MKPDILFWFWSCGGNKWICLCEKLMMAGLRNSMSETASKMDEEWVSLAYRMLADESDVWKDMSEE